MQVTNIDRISEVKASTPLQAVAGRAMKLVRIGGLLKGCCPFHGEKTPSFVVYRDHFHCYGCGAHGDVVDFVRLTHNVSLAEALRILGADEIRAVASVVPPEPEPDDWEPLPAPLDVKAPLDGYDHVYTYRDADGTFLRYICRVDGPPKRIIPLTWGRLNGRVGWHKRHALDRRLYRLDDLALRRDATVIVTEGEKAAEAAAALFPSRVAVTWSGGAQAILKTDWQPLAGRRVILWPDNDPPGLAAMEQVIKIISPFARAIAVLAVADLGPGDDAADVHPDDPEGWLQARLARVSQKNNSDRQGRP